MCSLSAAPGADLQPETATQLGGAGGGRLGDRCGKSADQWAGHRRFDGYRNGLRQGADHRPRKRTLALAVVPRVVGPRSTERRNRPAWPSGPDRRAPPGCVPCMRGSIRSRASALPGGAYGGGSPSALASTPCAAVHNRGASGVRGAAEGGYWEADQAGRVRRAGGPGLLARVDPLVLTTMCACASYTARPCCTTCRRQPASGTSGWSSSTWQAFSKCSRSRLWRSRVRAPRQGPVDAARRSGSVGPASAVQGNVRCGRRTLWGSPA